MTKQDESAGLPVIFYYPAVSLTLQCPSCGLESVITAKKPINRRAKASCGKCKKAFIIQPNVRKLFRKDVDLACKVSLKSFAGEKSKGALNAQLVNVSGSGLGVVAPWKVIDLLSLEVGVSIHVCFAIPKGTTQTVVDIKCVIRNMFPQKGSNKTIVGLEILDNDCAAVKKLAFFLWN